MILRELLDRRVIEAIRSNRVVVAPTDTIYGMLASAQSETAFINLYKIHKRPIEKSSIVLVSDIDDIPGLTQHQLEIYQKLNYDRPTTVITDAAQYYKHLPHQNGTLAFRLITQGDLSALIEIVGPIIAPSANIEGLSPAENIDRAISYFGDQIAIYVDGGTITSVRPSRIIKFTDDSEYTTIRD